MSWPEYQERDHPFKKDVLLTHHTEYTHSFALFVKGGMLLSRGKSYNMRYSQLKYADDKSLLFSEPAQKQWQCVVLSKPGLDPEDDPRRNDAFIELDHIAFNFTASFPAHLQTPFVQGVIDIYLYLAHLMPFVYVQSPRNRLKRMLTER